MVLVVLVCACVCVCTCSGGIKYLGVFGSPLLCQAFECLVMER